MAARSCITFPAPPLRFRTSGFPRYGSKLEFSRDLRPPGRGLSAYPAYPHAPANLYAATVPLSGSYGPSGNTAVPLAEPVVPHYPVQRPLARLRVVLSRWVIAYYGLIRNSRPLPPAYILRPGGSLPCGYVWAGTDSLPNLLPVSLPSVPPSVPRWTIWLPTSVPSPSALAFAQSAQARHPLRRGNRYTRGLRNEAAKFALCYGPGGLLALHRQGPLRSSFHLLSHLISTSSITTRANRQFPWPDFHRQDTQHYGLRTDYADWERAGKKKHGGKRPLPVVARRPP